MSKVKLPELLIKLCDAKCSIKDGEVKLTLTDRELRVLTHGLSEVIRRRIAKEKQSGDAGSLQVEKEHAHEPGEDTCPSD